MADGGGSERPQPKKTGGKKKVSFLRNVISTILLVTFATVAILEFQLQSLNEKQ